MLLTRVVDYLFVNWYVTNCYVVNVSGRRLASDLSGNG